MITVQTDRAVLFVAEKHLGQYRKNSGLPYVVHVLEVLKKLATWGVTDDDVRAAAVLHDYIEDCDMHLTYAQKYTLIAEDFNLRIADMVLECSREVDHESRQQKYDFLSSFRIKSVESVLIKVADRVCNCADYEREDKGDAYFLKYGLQAYPLFQRMYDETQVIRSKFVTEVGLKQLIRDVSDLTQKIEDKYSLVMLNHTIEAEVLKIVI